jgi:hypothetical protein
MSVFGGPNVTDSGLVLNLDAGNIKSYPGTGTIWYDRSVNGNNGILTNGPTFSGDSVTFDGTNDYVILNSSTDFNKPTNITANIWVKYGSFNPTGNGRAIFKSSNLNENTGITVYQNTGVPYNSLKTYVNTSSGLIILTSPTLLNTNQWYMVTVTYDSSLLKIYLNSDLDSSQAGGTDITWPETARTPIMGTSYNSYFNGNIAIVQIYNRALTAQEVLQNYNATKSRFNIT